MQPQSLQRFDTVDGFEQGDCGEVMDALPRIAVQGRKSRIHVVLDQMIKRTSFLQDSPEVAVIVFAMSPSARKNKAVEDPGSPSSGNGLKKQG